MALPKSFDNLNTAYNAAAETFLNVIGIVVDVLPPSYTAGSQYMFTFKLLDPSLRDAIYGTQGLTVRFFKSDLQQLPQIRRHGDIVLLKNVKMKPFSQQPMLISNYQTGVVVFPAGSIPEPGFQVAYQGTKRIECLGARLDTDKVALEDQAYVIQLKQNMASTLEMLPSNGSKYVAADPPVPFAAPTAPAAMRKRPGDPLAPTDSKKARESTFGPKFKLIREVAHRDFADLCGQVVKKFPNQFGTCELYITDYTENKSMFFYAAPEQEDDHEREGDHFGYAGPLKKAWPGPYGWHVLKINVKDPHASYANREVEEGDFILCKNVKMKQMTQLEGDMWPDDKNRAEVKIRKITGRDAPEVKAVLDRKEKYVAARDKKLLAANPPEGMKKPTKTKIKKQKKEKKQELAEKKQRLQDGAANPTESNKARETSALGDLGDGMTNARSKKELNPHIRCSHEEVPTRSINWILDSDDDRHRNQDYTMPFMCAKYRARVRVVDFYPRELEDFALPQLPEDDKSEHSVHMDWESSPQYEWSFSLLLEDASKDKTAIGDHDSIWVGLGHEEAQYLLGNGVDDPADLHDNGQLLASLREKLYILWGNLEETSEDQPISNRVFECCLMEYGMELAGNEAAKASSAKRFEKLFRMFGVTIL